MWGLFVGGALKAYALLAASISFIGALVFLAVAFVFTFQSNNLRWLEDLAFGPGSLFLRAIGWPPYNTFAFGYASLVASFVIWWAALALPVALLFIAIRHARSGVD